MKKTILLVGLTTLLLVIVGCSDLAGQPDIVRTIPTPNSPTVVDAVPQTVADIELGAQIYANRCTSCHGVTGAGDGELVESGQVTNIPNFTDIAQHADNTAEDYFEIITVGRIENLMPPFAGSLNADERWALANYVMTLSSDTALIVPASDTEVTSNTTTSESTGTTDIAGGSTHAGQSSAVVGNDGFISGIVTHANDGALPDAGVVTLHIMDMNNQEQTFETTIDANGAYTFEDVPVVTNAGYYVTMAYGDGYFNSPFMALDPDSPSRELNIELYNTTDDPSIISISMVLTQINRLSDDTVRIVQLLEVTNIGNELFVYDDAEGYNVALAVPLPANAVLSGENDFSRYYYSENDHTIYDTNPILPGAEHTVQVVYEMPMTNALAFEQSFPYTFNGPFEVYVDDTMMTLDGDGWLEVGTQTVSGIEYRGISLVNGQAPNGVIAFSANNKTPFVSSWVSYAMLALGISLLTFAVVMLYVNHLRFGTPQAKINVLTRQIADLDQQYDKKTISKKQYDKQRKSLKTELTDLMNALD